MNPGVAIESIMGKRVFTREELGRYNGKNGMPSYIA
jgi:hypothetical protein